MIHTCKLFVSPLLRDLNRKLSLCINFSSGKVSIFRVNLNARGFISHLMEANLRFLLEWMEFGNFLDVLYHCWTPFIGFLGFRILGIPLGTRIAVCVASGLYYSILCCSVSTTLDSAVSCAEASCAAIQTVQQPEIQVYQLVGGRYTPQPVPSGK